MLHLEGVELERAIEHQRLLSVAFVQVPAEWITPQTPSVYLHFDNALYCTVEHGAMHTASFVSIFEVVESIILFDLFFSIQLPSNNNNNEVK